MYVAVRYTEQINQLLRRQLRGRCWSKEVYCFCRATNEIFVWLLKYARKPRCLLNKLQLFHRLIVLAVPCRSTCICSSVYSRMAAYTQEKGISDSVNKSPNEKLQYALPWNTLIISFALLESMAHSIYQQYQLSRSRWHSLVAKGFRIFLDIPTGVQHRLLFHDED